MLNTAVVPRIDDEGYVDENADKKDQKWQKNDHQKAKTEEKIKQHHLAKQLEAKKMQQGGFTQLFGTWWHWTQILATSTNIISLIAFALIVLTVGLTYQKNLNTPEDYKLDEGHMRFQVDIMTNSSNIANVRTNLLNDLKNYIQTINPGVADIDVFSGNPGDGKDKLKDSNFAMVIEIKSASSAWSWCTDEESCTDTEKLYCDAIDYLSQMRNTINKPTRMLRVYNNLYPHTYSEQATTFCWNTDRQTCATSCMANFKCPELVAPPRSSMICDHGFFGTYHYTAACTFECNPNYIMSSGNTTLRCKRDGKWDGMLPDCMLNWNAITA